MMRLARSTRAANKRLLGSAHKYSTKLAQSEAVPASGGGRKVLPFILVGQTLIAAVGVVAVQPDSVREKMSSAGLLPAAEPLIAAIENATSGLRPTSKKPTPLLTPAAASNTAPPSEAKATKSVASKPADSSAATATPVVAAADTKEKKGKGATATQTTAPAAKTKTAAAAPIVSTPTAAGTAAGTAPAAAAGVTNKVEVVVVKDEPGVTASKAAAASQKTGLSDGDFEGAARRIELSSKLESLEEMSCGQAALRATLSKDLLADLDDLDRPALLYRLGNLMADANERSKLEALRQHDAWRRGEVEAHRKYAALLEDQKAELELRHQREVSSFRASCERGVLSATNERELAIASLDAQSQAEESKRLQEFFGSLQRAKESALVGSWEVARAAALEAGNSEACKSARSRLDAVGALEIEASEAGTALATDTTSTEHASGTHRSIAHTLLLTDGAHVPSVLQLQAAFNAAHDAGMKAALIPKGFEGTSFGRLLGSALARLRVSTPLTLGGGEEDQDKASSNSAANGNSDAALGAEVLLGMAKVKVERGGLREAVDLMRKLEGAPSTEVKDWVADASRRLEADSALAALSAKAPLF